MDTIDLILHLLIFAWILFLPQFIGVLVHYRMRGFPRIAYFVGFFLTTIFSFYLMITVFAIRVQPDEQVCGLGAMAEGFLILFFTSIQMFVSVFAQLWLRARKILMQAQAGID